MGHEQFAELEGLWQGLNLAQQHSYFPLIIEGDSQILINMAQQIIHGTPVNKLSCSWRLATHLQHIEHLLATNKAITFKQIKRNGNKVADLLANLGVISDRTLYSGSLEIIKDATHQQEYTKLVQMDAAPRMQVLDEPLMHISHRTSRWLILMATCTFPCGKLRQVLAPHRPH